MFKLLTDKRGPLQGVTLESIVKNAYGINARYVPDTEGESVGLIIEPDTDHVLDSVVEMHETDG